MVVMGKKLMGEPNTGSHSHMTQVLFFLNHQISQLYIHNNRTEPKARKLKIKEGANRPTLRGRALERHKMTYPSNDLSPRLFGFLWDLASNCVETQSLRPSPKGSQTALGKKELVFHWSNTNQLV